jgi:O-antigen/teichoic acid export membrane protein
MDDIAKRCRPSQETAPDPSRVAQPRNGSPKKTGSKEPYRDLLKHSSIYGLVAILTRLASFLLLPFYTSYLRPAEYGCIAILDVTSAVLGILITAGIASAVTRYNFEAKDDHERDRVWWTGLTIVAVMATALVTPAWLVRDPLARLTLGSEQVQGSFYYQLILVTLWFDATGQMLDAFMRVRKWSALFAGSSFLFFLFNIALNVLFVAVFGMGVSGILLGNLISCSLRRLFLLALFMLYTGPYAFDRALGAKLLRFGSPLILTALLTLVMNQADLYLLRLFISMDQVGIYSLAASIGRAFYTVLLLPFGSIWGVVIYEIAEQPRAKKVYAQVFQYFVYCQMLVFLSVSLVAKPVLALVTASDYADAADLIPIVCLAYLFFSLHEHFKVPALLAKRTLSLLPAFVTAAATTLVANLCLIPTFGPTGSAWVSVLTFAVFSFVGLWRYRLIDKYPYPFFRCALVLLGMISTYIASRQLPYLGLSGFWLLAVLALMWFAWAVLLLGRAWRLLPLLLPSRSRQQSTEPNVARAESEEILHA